MTPRHALAALIALVAAAPAVGAPLTADQAIAKGPCANAINARGNAVINIRQVCNYGGMTPVEKRKFDRFLAQLNALRANDRVQDKRIAAGELSNIAQNERLDRFEAALKIINAAADALGASSAQKRIAELIERGDIEEAAALLGQEAETKLAAGGEAPSLFYQQAILLQGSKLEDARAAINRAVMLEPDNVDFLWLAGDISLALGDSPAAREFYLKMSTAAARKAGSDPRNSAWQREISVSYNNIGDVGMTQGESSAALKNYDDAIKITKMLVVSDPNNSEWLHDLFACYVRVGDAYATSGQIAAALKNYRFSLSVIKALVIINSDNSGWQLDLSRIYHRIGKILSKKGNTKTSLKNLYRSLDILKKLISRSSSNTDINSDLSRIYIDIGDIQFSRGKDFEAFQLYKKSLVIDKTLSFIDSSNTGRQDDLSVSYTRVGNVQVLLGDNAAALKSYGDALAINKKLAARDPRNNTWQLNLALSYAKIGVFSSIMPLDKRRNSLQNAIDIVTKLQASGRLPDARAGLPAFLQSELDDLENGESVSKTGN